MSKSLKQMLNKNRRMQSRRQVSGGSGTTSTSPYIATSSFSRPTHCSIPRGPQIFPDILDTHSKTLVDLGMSGSAASQHTYHLNSPAKFFGPQVNWTGAFADNVPAGMYYLLSSNTVAGSVAPYFLACTHDIDIEYEFININTIAAYVTLLPSYQVSLSGMSQSQLAEQRGAVQIFVPASQAQVYKIRAHYSVRDVLGIKQEEVLNNSNYRQLAGALPPISIYGHLIVSSVDGATTVAMQTKATFMCHTRYTTTNSFVTSVPA
jgi:hypothetical protein